MKKLFKQYQNHLIVLLGSNISGFLSLVLALVIFSVGNEVSYNEYTSYAAYFLILSTPSKIAKSLTTTYGYSLIGFLKKNVKNIKVLYFLLFLICIGVSLTIFQTVGGTFLDSVFLVLSVILNFFLLFRMGLLQNSYNFFDSSFSIVIQNIFKLISGLLLFLFIGNTGIWLGFVISTILTLKLFQNKFNTVEKETNNTSVIIFQDVFINLILFLLLEFLFNIDSIFITNKLSTIDAYHYNSLILVKKTVLFAIIGFSQIILSSARKTNTNKLNSLFRNLTASIMIFLPLAFFFFIFKNFILSYLKLDSSFVDLYIKLIISTSLFSIFTIISSWFASIRRIYPRLLFIAGIIAFCCYFLFSISDIAQTINSFLFGIIVLLLYQILLVIFVIRKVLYK